MNGTHESAPTLRFSYVRLKNGIRLRYAQQGDASGHPIILLHGYTDSGYSYSRILPLISKRYRVFVLDQRGHGDSDRPAEEYGMPTFAADILAFMDANGLKTATIIGHSMGSFIAQHLAVMAPQRVSRIVLIASADTMRNDVILSLKTEVNALSDPIPRMFVREFQTSTIFQKVPDEFMKQVINESMKLPARVWRLVIAGMLASDAEAELNKIKAPALIVWGDQDAIFSRSAQDALVGGLTNSVLKIYARTGHAPHWEQPARFVGDLEDFIDL